MSKIKIFNIQHFSLHDGPGIRTVVFFKGCPLNCAWCHNPESKSPHTELAYYNKNCQLCGDCLNICPYGAHSITQNVHTIDRTKCTACGICAKACDYAALEIIGKELTADEIINEIKKDDVFFGDNGGVTISGGEPFMQFDGLFDLVTKCKSENYSVCIETSGFTSKDKLLAIANHIDWFLYDYKLTDANEHLKYVGQNNNLIIENLSVLDTIGANVVLRCPIIPGVNDHDEHFKSIASIMNNYTCIKHAELMPYHPLGISKSEQLGNAIEFGQKEFLAKDKAKKYAEYISKFTDKKVITT